MIKCHKCAQPYDSSSQRVGFQIVYEVTCDTCLQETEETVMVVKLQDHDIGIVKSKVKVSPDRPRWPKGYRVD